MARGMERDMIPLGESCYTCDHLDYDERYVDPCRCLLNKPERFSYEELERRFYQSINCGKYKRYGDGGQKG